MRQVIEREPEVEAPEPKASAASPGDQPSDGTWQRWRAWLFGPIGLTALVFILFVGLMGYGFTVLVGAGMKASQDTRTTDSNSIRSALLRLSSAGEHLSLPLPHPFPCHEPWRHGG